MKWVNYIIKFKGSEKRMTEHDIKTNNQIKSLFLKKAK